jgi:uncharacterized membrane protein
MTPKIRQLMAETRTGLHYRQKAQRTGNIVVAVIAAMVVVAASVVVFQTSHKYDQLGLQTLFEILQ